MTAAALRWARRFRRIGVRVAISKLTTRLWSTHFAVIVAAETSMQTSDAAEIPLSYSFVPSEQLDASELDRASVRGSDALYVEGLARLYGQAAGDAIVARTPEGALVAVGLVSYPDRHARLDAMAPGLHQQLAPDACWTEAHYVLPEYRRKRVMAGVLEAERSFLNGRGIRTVYALIESRNEASLRVFARAGYRPTGIVSSYRYRLNRLATRSVAIDAPTSARWQRATDEAGAAPYGASATKA
jgi:RimJ/RimL family protein N-acetyltransferase